MAKIKRKGGGSIENNGGSGEIIIKYGEKKKNGINHRRGENNEGMKE